MTDSWSLKELREFILSIHGKNQYLYDLIFSISRSIDIFRYHVGIARDSLEGYFDEDDQSNEENFKLVMGHSERSQEFNEAKLANEANTIAAIYTVRSLYDLFAQLVRALLLADSLDEAHCNIFQVTNKLSPSQLKDVLSKLLESDGFSYVNAFANVSKHRYLVKHGASINTVNSRAGVKFSPFKFRGEQFSDKWAQDVLELVVQVQNHVVIAGKELNRHCNITPS
ncbi:hypothetical protein [Marinobacter sp. V034]|uniref:hypothetical protein n=1 Tax=Marinobacter sp. V034 TaxID=3459610 RepID=UPI004043EFA6